jgi:large subunit ribosomal protein L28
MSRCELTGKGPIVKNLVSHSNIKTKSRALPNVQQKRVFSRSLNSLVSLKMAVRTIRSLEHVGGFDTFILNQPDKLLSKRALEIKGRIMKKLNRPAKGDQK